jgi:hypothetical protein
MSYQPASGSLAARVCAYFAKHRDEVLSAADIALKFDASNVATNLATALTHKALERFKAKGSSVWQYRAGRNLDAALAAPPLEPSTPRPKPSPFPTVAGLPIKVKRVLPPPLPDDALLAVEADVPLPPERARGPKRTNWAVLFERLAQPGLCSSPLPIEHIGAGKAAAKKHGKEATRTYAVHPINDTHFRIWRTA